MTGDCYAGLAIETDASSKKKRKSRKNKGGKEAAPMTEEEEEAAMHDEVGTLKEQIAALRQQMQSNDAILAGIDEEEGDSEDATMNGVRKKGENASDSEGTATASSDEDDDVVVRTSHTI